MISKPLIKYILTAALRDRLLLVLLLMMVVGGSLSVFLGSSAITESDRFALVFASSGLRLGGVIGLVLFVVFYVRRAFDSRDVEFLLSRPLSRVTFISSHAVSFSLLALLVALVVIFSICMVSVHHIQPGVLLWGLSLAAELIIMANAALFFSMILPSATAGAMATFALYVLGRLMGELLGIVYSGSYTPGYHVMAVAMKTVSVIAPRLDLMAQSSWLIYGPGGDAINPGYVFMQGVIYSLLLIVAALVDMVRRQF
jgi:hypothetical protein